MDSLDFAYRERLIQAEIVVKRDLNPCDRGLEPLKLSVAYHQLATELNNLTKLDRLLCERAVRDESHQDMKAVSDVKDRLEEVHYCLKRIKEDIRKS